MWPGHFLFQVGKSNEQKITETLSVRPVSLWGSRALHEKHVEEGSGGQSVALGGIGNVTGI